jgi:hypothetical protein
MNYELSVPQISCFSLILNAVFIQKIVIFIIYRHYCIKNMSYLIKIPPYSAAAPTKCRPDWPLRGCGQAC